MKREELAHGHYYTLRGAEHTVWWASRTEDDMWILEDEDHRRLVVQGSLLMEGDRLGRAIQYSGWLLDDLMPDSQEHAARGNRLVTLDLKVWGDVLRQ